jgi:hypothetical protein
VLQAALLLVLLCTYGCLLLLHHLLQGGAAPGVAVLADACSHAHKAGFNEAW